MSSSTAQCSWYTKSCMKTRLPIYSALGPFPDEPLLTSIDRFLFWFGSKRAENYISSESSSKGDYNRGRCSTEREIEHKIHHNNERSECLVKESPTYSVVPNIENIICEKCSCKKLKFPETLLSHCCNTSGENFSTLENSCRKENEDIEKPVRPVKRSFSLCSLACRKLKEKLKFAETTSDRSPKWLWTKMKNYAGGIQVFEVFKNSSAATHPTKFDTSKAPKIIFIILPTGSIMPFETIPRH